MTLELSLAEEYAINTAAEGIREFVSSDPGAFYIDQGLTTEQWEEACDLGLEMANIIEKYPTSFRDWFYNMQELEKINSERTS